MSVEASFGATSAPASTGAPYRPSSEDLLAPSTPVDGPSSRERLDRALASINWAPFLATAGAFAILFAKPITLLVRDWWTLPEAGHGLLLAPVAIFIAWRSGIRSDAKPQ